VGGGGTGDRLFEVGKIAGVEIPKGGGAKKKKKWARVHRRSMLGAKEGVCKCE